MKKKLDFLVPDTMETVKSRIRQYFWKNGYYELRSKSGLKFARESGSEIALSPRRLDHQFEIHVSDLEPKMQVRVVFRMNASSYLPTIIDKEFVNDLLEHFKSCITTGQIGVFDIERYEKKIKPYSKKYALGFSVLILLSLIALFFDLLFLVLTLLLMAPTVGILLINRQIAKNRRVNS